ncbi:MAG: hypothetical protein ACYTE8_10250 [Planctomycetota bacterium]|jgi:ABC-type transport system involved in multi-copper enzyme maturation permease subunit
MFTLIKREVIDNIVFFLAAALLGLMLAGIILSMSLGGDMTEGRLVVFGSFFPIAGAVLIGLSFMGSTQIQMDKMKKVYSVLFTKPVSRSQVLFAKVISGLLAILILLLPVFCSAAFLLNSREYIEFPGFGLLFPGIFISIAISVLMLFLGCYCLGLMCGLSSNKVIPAFGGIVLSALLVPILVIKGFGFEALGIIILLVVLCLLFVWKRFLLMSV